MITFMELLQSEFVQGNQSTIALLLGLIAYLGLRPGMVRRLLGAISMGSRSRTRKHAMRENIATGVYYVLSEEVRKGRMTKKEEREWFYKFNKVPGLEGRLPGKQHSIKRLKDTIKHRLCNSDYDPVKLP